ncbi:hypothetical protein [Kutzneria albida]|uniref:Uncharacterized protein n=1 Tax=Kutzneria albida DSM 43870 TaxID=1449976 RepID=W5WK76_9PSEU|nr:hypothetical protein [Kutzneria albida]AHH98584.1 hypothetical protein KALB_5222 [Kutzneria albida DSM 43870]
MLDLIKSMLAVGDTTSWIAAFAAALVGLYFGCVVVTLAVALFHRRKADRDSAYAVLRDLLAVFGRRSR